ncbi:MAG: endonuclease/exonuclease/phosphatase family protein [Roseicyclus sp.]|nr:endonuclease/exonuclease/phosphatase family protein [Roseicyclus sp.]
MEDVVEATVAVILEVRPDILTLQDFDYDADGLALAALAEALAQGGLYYPHQLVLRPNTGWPTGFDLDGDGYSDGPRDAHGYGRFNGSGGIALLSRYPLGEVRNFSDLLWRDLPDSAAEGVTPAAALPILRLHTVAAWDVAVQVPGGTFHVLMSHATTPVFDGPEDRNGLRNADEVRFWQLYLEGWSPDGRAFSAEHFAIMGTLNVDPDRGEGLQAPLLALLNHPAVQDPGPDSPTTDWDEPTPGNLRVDYILPARSLHVQGAGVLWPSDGPLAEVVEEASDHRLIWVDVEF